MQKSRLSLSVLFHSPTFRLFLQLLLLLLLLNINNSGVNGQNAVGNSRDKPTTTPTLTATVNGSTWNDNVANIIQSLFGALKNNGSSGQNVTSWALGQFISKLPSFFRGGEGGGGGPAASQGGNDVAQILTNLFADSRTNGTPAWIEALVQGSNSSQVLQSVFQQMPKVFQGQQGGGTQSQNLQTLLSSVFQNIPKGLSSLNLNASSSPQDIVKAILQDPSLMSSLPSTVLSMLGNVSGQVGMQAMLMDALKNQFPVDPRSQCGADLRALGVGLQQGQMWALKMLDAMGKVPPGIFQGRSTLFGDYDECDSISYTTPQRHTIEGLLCGVAIKAPDALAKLGKPVIGLHLCLPKTCNDEDLYNLLQPTLKSIGSENYGQYCYRPRSPSADDSFAGAVTVFAILGALCMLGTFFGAYLDHHNPEKKQLYELQARASTQHHANAAFVPEETPANQAAGNGGPHVVASSSSNENVGYVNGEKVHPPPYTKVSFVGPEPEAQKVAVPETSGKQGEEGLCSKLLLSFSVLRNGRKVLNCAQSPNDIGCLHGIRVLSITWVILGHCFTQLGDVQANPGASIVFLQHFTYAVFPGALFAVDTFFLLSGCLTALLFIRSTRKSGLTVSAVILYYVHRIWRLTPLYGLMLVYYIGIFPYTKKGPFQNRIGMDSEGTCRDYWYFNILYVNNVVDDSLQKICFGWSWYLSNDMQFAVIAPVILIPWVLRGKLKIVGELLGCFLTFGLIVAHTVTTAVITKGDNLSVFNEHAGDYMEKVYFTPWCRVGPYAVGLLLGFALSKTPRKVKLPPLAVWLGWISAWAVGLTLVYITYDNLKDLMHGTRWSMDQIAAYEALAKWIWAICVGWVIFACYTGYGGFVNSLLSWSAWAPLSRLTYGVYLIHMVVIFTLMGNQKTSVYMDGWTGTELTLAVTVLSYLSSFIFSMLIEAPTLGLEKAVLGKIFKRKKE